MQTTIKIVLVIFFLLFSNILYAQKGTVLWNDFFYWANLYEEDKNNEVALKNMTKKYNSLKIKYKENPSLISDVEKRYKQLTKSNYGFDAFYKREALQKEINAKLNSEYANLTVQPGFKQRPLKLRAADKIEEAIKSVKIVAVGEEAAKRHIFLAELYIDNFQFYEAEQHFIKAVSIYPSPKNYYAAAGFFSIMGNSNKAIEYFNYTLKKEAYYHDYIKEDKRSLKDEEIYMYYQVRKEEFYYMYLLKKIDLYYMYLTKKENVFAQSPCIYFSESESSYKDSLEIRRILAVVSPQEYLPKVASTLNNLAKLHSDIGNSLIAFEEYDEALEIFRSLSVSNPQAYLPDDVQSLNNLAKLHSDTGNSLIALEEYKEALEIYRTLSDSNPQAYLPDVAKSLNNLANLHSKTGDFQKALEEYKESLKILKTLAVSNPQVYLPYVAETLNNLSSLHISGIPNKELSLKYANEALDILSKCNDTPSVREQLEKAVKIIEIALEIP